MRHSAASNVVEHTQVAALDAGTVHLVTKGVGGGCPGVTCSMPTLVDIHAFQSEAPHCVGGSLSWSIPICRHPAITVLASSTAGDIRADKTCRVPRSEQMESAEKIRCRVENGGGRDCARVSANGKSTIHHVAPVQHSRSCAPFSRSWQPLLMWREASYYV